ncbi:phage tail tape measure protein [Candidatus Fermentibacteria bacterium]|nr:MAG: phage tail tape measure protein [Candidatus Fermentibacteria bacterium]
MSKTTHEFSLVWKSKGGDRIKDDTDDFTKSLNKLDAAIKKNVQGQKVMRKEIERLEESGKGLGQEWRILHNDLDKSGEQLKKQRGLVDRYADGMDEAATATDENVAAIKKLQATTEEEVKTQSKLNEEIKEGKEASDAYIKAVEREEQVIASLTLETDKEVVAAKAAVVVTQQQAVELEQVKRETNEYVEAIQTKRRVDREARTETERLGRELDETTEDMRAARSATYQLRVEEKKLEQQTKFLGVSVDDLKKSLITGLAAGGAAGLAAKGMDLITDAMRQAWEGMKEFQRQSTETFSNLEEEVARARAQIGELNKSQEELYRGAVDYSRELARGPVETQVALRKAMNLGLDYNESLKAIAASSDAARVAGADMTDTLITAVSTVNAYGEGVYDVNQVLDQYAYITQNSNLETEDLIQGMAKIISPAAEAGVGLEEVAAAMVVMSKQGDDFNEIGELLGLLLTQIAIDGTQLGTAFKDAAGIGFREFTAGGGTLVEAMRMIEEHADSTNQSMGELVIGNSKFYRDAQAGRGIYELTGRHLEDLEEANLGAAAATGALNEQMGEFEGTLYLANAELESAKENAYAAEGSLTKMAAVDWAAFKTQGYDNIAGLSTQLALTGQMVDLIKEQEAGYGTLQLQMLSVSALQKDYGDDFYAAEQASFELQRETVRLMKETEGITLEEIELGLIKYQQRKEQVAQLEHAAILSERIRDAGFSQSGEAQKALEAARVAADLQERQTTALDQALDKEDQLRGLHEQEAAYLAYQNEMEAKQLAIQEEQLAIELQFRLAQADIYKESQGIVANFMALNEQLGETTDAKGIEELTGQIEALNEEMGDHFRQKAINAMLATDGYTAATVDLAVEMGLLTHEAGLLQKAYVNTGTEIENLRGLEGFDALDTKEKAEAIGLVADGLATATQAFAVASDSTKWLPGLEQGIIKAEELFDVTPTVEMPQAEKDELAELKKELELIKDTEWKAAINVDGGQAVTDTKAVTAALGEVKSKDVVITVTTVHKTTTEDPERTAATGADFTVPPGFQNDDFWLGLTSGEQVTVTPPGLGRSGGGDGAAITVINQFDSGTHNTTAVSEAVDDGLYQALLKAGLI